MPINPARTLCRDTSHTMTRRRRRVLAWLGILGIAFAQVAVTAHACITGAFVHASAAHAVAMSHQGHCVGAQGAAPVAPVAPTANACEVQCTDGAPTGAAPDLPPVLLDALPVAHERVGAAIDLREWDRSVLAATSAGPPPLLQFGRLLN
jgi:hypothetical protein